MVILPFPFVARKGIRLKARPALILSDHSIDRRFDDIILAGITSQRISDIKPTEYLVSEENDGFKKTGLAKSSVVRCEYVMTIPSRLIARKIGILPENFLKEVDGRLKISLGLP
ncbi:MAG: hypothetical protein GF398_08145 [Chitinivibrionales bacterium]|nr:hypothetical protein [Chitinivibrionales bacterium]